jgi:hypothetical protein
LDFDTILLPICRTIVWNYEKCHPPNSVKKVTFPRVAKTSDFGSNFASITSVAGFLLHNFFQAFSSLSKLQMIISFPALNNKPGVT